MRPLQEEPLGRVTLLAYLKFSINLRAALHYGGELHWSVKKFRPSHGCLR